MSYRGKLPDKRKEKIKTQGKKKSTQLVLQLSIPQGFYKSY